MEAEKEALSIIEKARADAETMIKVAEHTAELLVEKTRKETGQMIVDSIKTAFGEGEEEQKIIRLNRIPYICEDISGIKKDVKNIFKTLYLGIGGLTIISFFLPFILHYFFH